MLVENMLKFRIKGTTQVLTAYRAPFEGTVMLLPCIPNTYIEDYIDDLAETVELEVSPDDGKTWWTINENEI